MRFFMFIMLACCAVSCDDNSNNYYIVEMPADDPPVKTFNVYWNVPTMQCKSRKVLFENLYEKYGIIQNADDNFRGEKITILYEPGLFPAIFKNESSGKYRFRNGGVPQEGDLQEHLLAFRRDMDDIIPYANFSGVAIIDFESWRPIFRQNFGTLVPYKDVSYEIERKLHPWWPTVWVQSEAKRRFQEAARKFMQTTISVAKQMRPKAIWGYYGFPHCFNMAQSNLVEECSSDVIKENDQTYWLWGESTALLPSIYRAHDLTPSQLAGMIRGRVGEAARVRRRNSAILPYFWFRYRDSGFITQNDLSAIFNALYKSDASGFVIWGSSNDVNTLEKCVNLQNYVENVFGPAIALYTKRLNKHTYEVTETPEELSSSEVNYSTTYNDDRYITIKPNASDINESTPNYHELKDKLDPEMVWSSPTNDTIDLSSNIAEELLKKRYSQTVRNDTDGNYFNKNIIFNILMSSLITLKNVSHIDDGKDNITTENNSLIKPEPVRVDSNIQTDNPLGAENVTSYDNRQYNRKEDSTIRDNGNEDSTISDKNISEVNETSSTSTLYTSSDSTVLFTSTTESLYTNVSSNYNETTQRDVDNITSKDLPSESTTLDSKLLTDNITSKDLPSESTTLDSKFLTDNITSKDLPSESTTLDNKFVTDNITSKDLPSESTTLDNKFLTFENIEKDSKDEYFIFLNSDKSLVDKSTQKTDIWTNEDITSFASDLSTKQYVDSTTDKMLENENYTEQETISSTDIF